jgi:hypothetical protein
MMDVSCAVCDDKDSIDADRLLMSSMLVATTKS